MADTSAWDGPAEAKAASQEHRNADPPGAGARGADKSLAVVEDDALDDLLDNVLDDLVSDQPGGLPAKIAHGGTAATMTAAAAEASLGPRRGCEGSRGDEEKAGNKESSAALEEEFAKQLAAGMEELVQSMGGPERAGEFQRTMEQMIKQLAVEGSKAPPPSSSSSGAATSSGAGTTSKPAGTGTFQDKIDDTLNKLRSSSSQVGAELAEDSADDLLADMMRQMGDMADLGDIDNVLEEMMQQLTPKEILYDPLVELSKKYPKWLEKNKDEVSEDDYMRYQRQLSVIREIIKEYERPGSDDGPTSEDETKKIVELMQAMQENGQPPKEILDELAPGIELGEDGQPKLGEGAGCSIM